MKLSHVLAGVSLAAIQSAWAGFPDGIASGDTTQTSTVLWAASNTLGDVRFQVMADGKTVADQSVAVTDRMVPAKWRVDGLTPGTRYSYTATGPDGKLLTGSFKTAAATGQVDLSFGVTGDWRGELAPYPAIKNVPASALDFFIKLGDTIYADYGSPAVPGKSAETLHEFRLKHREVYGKHAAVNTFARLQKDVSIFATIDDHEVRNDFAGGAAPDAPFLENASLVNQTALYSAGMQAFVEYNAIADQRYPVANDVLTDGRPDLYRAQRYGTTAGVYILDARSFRDKSLDGVTDITDAAQVGGFIAQTFDAFTPATTRTMLGRKQLERLKADLLAAQQDHVVWKFIAVPEPIQNMGVLFGQDRFEGYASERSELLGFIDENGIKNVVFISADIHGTIINDLTYQRRADVLTALATAGNPLAAPQIKTSAFEISTGSVAFAPAFGDAVLELLAGVPNGDLFVAQLFGAVGVSDLQGFNALPMTVKNAAFQGLMDNLLGQLGYTPVGLQDNDLIDAKLEKGGNTALFSFGWSRFDIDAATQSLKITTYGIEPYTQQDLTDQGAAILGRQPEIVSQLVVQPQS